MRRKTKPVLVNTLGTWDLQSIVSVLNSETSPSRDELRKLVARWEESGPNLKRMLAADKELAHKLENLWDVKYRPSTTGRANLELWPKPIKYPEEYEPALQIFSRLTFNPTPEKLSGKPCARCGQYYVKRRTNQNIYCSRKCGNMATALKRTQTARKEDRKDKVQKAEEVMRDWRPKMRIGWKEFVARETELETKLKLTVAWLTRAVNRKWLRPPVGATA